MGKVHKLGEAIFAWPPIWTVCHVEYTARGTAEYSVNWRHVTCLRCLVKRPKRKSKYRPTPLCEHGLVRDCRDCGERPKRRKRG